MNYVLNQSFFVSEAHVVTRIYTTDKSGEWPPKPREECYEDEEIDLPPEIHGYSLEDEDGNLEICINPKAPPKYRQGTLIHEMDHGRHGHLQNDWMTRSEKENIAYKNT